MGKIIRKLDIIETIIATLGRIFSTSYQTGVVELTYGQHEILIETDEVPKRVWFSINETEENLPVCQGNVNKIGVNMLDNGFILYGDVQSTTCSITWFVSF